MPIKIIKPNEPIITENITMLIYGEPGMGKSTLGFTAKNTLIIDFDNGVSSIERNGCEILSVKTWGEITDLTLDDLKPFDTIVIDTVGRLLEVMTPDIIQKNAKYGYSGKLNKAGWGELKARFYAWKNLLNAAKKDIVFIAHMTEDKSGDVLIKRFDVVGGAKEEIKRCTDMIGYVYLDNNNRVIDFEPADWKMGKNRGKIEKQVINKNNKKLLANIIEETKNNMNSLNLDLIKAEKEFNAVLDDINALETIEEFNKMLGVLKDADPLHKQALVKSAAGKNIQFDKSAKVFFIQPDLDIIDITNDLPENI